MGYEIEPSRPRIAAFIIGLCLTVLLGPSVLVWAARGTGFVAGCASEPQLCHGTTFGWGLQASLTLAWWIGTKVVLLIALATITAAACFAMRRPLAAGLALLFLPILPSLLPMLAVYVSRYRGCDINPDGIGVCMFWGTAMGKAFHTAATVPDLIYGFVPYSFAIALIVGVVGWFVTRSRAISRPQTAVQFQRFEDTRN